MGCRRIGLTACDVLWVLDQGAVSTAGCLHHHLPEHKAETVVRTVYRMRDRGLVKFSCGEPVTMTDIGRAYLRDFPHIPAEAYDQEVA